MTRRDDPREPLRRQAFRLLRELAGEAFGTGEEEPEDAERAGQRFLAAFDRELNAALALEPEAREEVIRDLQGFLEAAASDTLEVRRAMLGALVTFNALGGPKFAEERELLAGLALDVEATAKEEHDETPKDERPGLLARAAAMALAGLEGEVESTARDLEVSPAALIRDALAGGLYLYGKAAEKKRAAKSGGTRVLVIGPDGNPMGLDGSDGA